ncbi:hypothetical protein LCGC14_0951580 [marine sediment metagenome]|uniref:Uncharacterized protein n=1 Tax=marine sediment metagenome TaxID=412755 RepID=A0A0F9NLT3_9ZZZZ
MVFMLYQWVATPCKSFLPDGFGWLRPAEAKSEGLNSGHLYSNLILTNVTQDTYVRVLGQLCPGTRPIVSGDTANCVRGHGQLCPGDIIKSLLVCLVFDPLGLGSIMIYALYDVIRHDFLLFRS